MIILLLSCINRIDFNIKTTREEISKAIIKQNKSLLWFSYDKLHEENAEGLIPIEEAILKEKIKAINILLKEVSFGDVKRVASKAEQRNSIEVYKLLKRNDKELLPYCLKIAKEENDKQAIEKILEVMEATELEREILLGTKESVKLEGELKEGNESIIAVSEEEIFEIIQQRADRKVFLACLRLEYEEKALKIVEQLKIKERTETFQRELIIASQNGHWGAVSLLLQAGAKVDQKNKGGFTALMLASEQGHEGVVRILLERSAKIDERNSDGNTALMLASKQGHEGVVKILLERGAKVDEKSIVDKMLIIICLNKDKTKLDLEILLKEELSKLVLSGLYIELSDSERTRALIWASQRGYEGVVSLLLQAGVRVDEKDNHGFTALMLASQQYYEGAVTILLKAGAQVNEKNKDGWTALMRASQYGDECVVILLLKAGAEVDEKNKDDFTALMLASCKGCEAIVSLLLKAGAKVDEKDKDGNTALMLASCEGCEIIVSLLLKAGAKVDKKNKDGVTALMLASCKGCEIIVSLLLKAGSNVYEKDKDGLTALMLASRRGSEAIVSLLLKAGSNVYEKDKDGATPLMLASMKGNQKVVKVLLRFNKDCSKRCDYKGRTFLYYLKLEDTIELLDLGLIDINDINEDGMTNFYSILKGFAANKLKLERYKILVITLLTRYSARRLF